MRPARYAGAGHKKTAGLRPAVYSDDSRGKVVGPEIFICTLDGLVWRHTFVEIVTPPRVGQVVKTDTDLCAYDLIALTVEAVKRLVHFFLHTVVTNRYTTLSINQ
jgi:hypothetical protein